MIERIGVDRRQRYLGTAIAVVRQFSQSRLLTDSLLTTYRLDLADRGVRGRSTLLANHYGARGTDEPARTAVLHRSVPTIGTQMWTHDAQDIGFDAPAVLTSPGKRALDVSVSLVLLLMLSPLWFVVAVLIKLTSRGPVIFRQQRLGVGGRTFTLLKFRTMRNGSPDEVHRDFVTRFIRGDAVSSSASLDAAYKLNGDARITSVGRLLRKLSIDEFPQLLNVLRGEMSLVGPRPPLAYEVDNYEPWQMERLTARPGITGLWQVTGRNRLTHDEMCRRDIEYIRTWSLMKDVRIMLRTPWVMLVDGGGAA